MSDQNTRNLDDLRRSLFRPIDPTILGVYRIVFGSLMVLEVKRLWNLLELYVAYPCNLPLDPFGLIAPASKGVMQIELLLMLASCILVIVGFRPRITILPLLVGYFHFFFSEQTQFNNHYYLILLFQAFFVAIDSSAALSVDSRGRAAERRIPFWNLALLRGQFVLVYFYGGLAKITPDWLRGEPMTMHVREMLGPDTSLAEWIGPIGVFLCYSGMVFDLGVGFALLFPRTRLLILPFLISFHVSNSFMFDIGIFPWLCIASTLLFYPPDQVAKVLSRWVPRREPEEGGTPLRDYAGPTKKRQRLIVSLLAIYCVVQILLPFRHRLVPGNFHWTREHFFFAWTMKLAQRDDFMAVEVFDSKTSTAYLASPEKDLYEIPETPNGIWDYCNYVAQVAVEKGITTPEVYVVYISSLNGRPYQMFVDATVPINLQPRPNMGHADWVIPLEEDAPIGNSATEAERNQMGLGLLREIILNREAIRRRQGVDTRGYFQQS